MRAVLAVGLAMVGPLAAQRPVDRSITNEELAGRLRHFSSDLFEGRYPGSRGEALTTSYLISELESFGLEPGLEGKWLQPISVVVHDPLTSSPNTVTLSGRIQRNLEHGQDIRLANNAADGVVDLGGEVVFVGYGIDAPTYRWNDFAGLDLKGKIVIGLLGEPSVAGDTALFNGGRASRYSWTRDKVDDLDKRGAIGVLWVVKGPLSKAPVGGARRLADRARASGVKFTGNITETAVAGLLPPGSPDLAALTVAAAKPGFKAMPLDVTMHVSFATTPRIVTTNNVVAVVPGTDKARAGEHIVLSAHWDAYGVGQPVGGDSVFNGALDDGSGVTQLLALARVFSQYPEPRSLTFLFTTSEEWGLLGAEGFVCSRALPWNRIVANLNLDDGTELFGPKRDIAPLGIELSSLGANVATLAAKAGLRVTPDPFPAEGFFLRADNFPFARAGIPALYMALGTDAVGRPKGWTDERVKEYLERQYHQRSDDYATVVADIAGAKQLAEFTRDLTSLIARAPGRPQWNRGAEFARSDQIPSACP